MKINVTNGKQPINLLVEAGTYEKKYKTAEGNPVILTDAWANYPLKSLGVNMNPIQDLHGYDHPWVGGGGKNLFDVDAWIALGRNSNYYSVSDGAVSAIADDVGGIADRLIQLKPSTQYTISFANASNCRVFDDSGNTIAQTNSQTSASFTTTASGQIAVKFYGSTYPTVIGKVQIEEGNTATVWTPYENICPISGWSSVDVKKTGVNVVGGEVFANGIKTAIPQAVLDTDAKTISYVSGYASDGTNFTNGIPFKENTQYTIILKFSNTKARTNTKVVYTDGTTQYIPTSTTGLQTVVFTSATNKTIDYIGGLNSDGTSVFYYDECGVFEGVLTADQFKPYQGQTITKALGQTVYGGTLDVVSGTLTVDRAMVDLGTLNWINHSSGVFWAIINSKAKGVNNIVCSQYETASTAGVGNLQNNQIVGENGGSAVYIKDTRFTTDAATFKTAMSGVQLVYELAEPQTIQLTPEEVKTLMKETILMTNADSLSVEYRTNER